MKNITYFYDSDLYGGSVYNIASSVELTGDERELDRFCRLWGNRIDEIKDDKHEQDVFVHLLVDLGQCLRDRHSIQMKLLVSDNDFMDFLFFLSIYSTDKVNVVKDIEITKEYSKWVELGYPSLLAKVTSVIGLKTLGDLYAQGYQGKETIKEVLLHHKYQSSELAMLQESYSSQVCKYAENRIPIYFKMFKSVKEKVIVPNVDKNKGFYDLYNKIAKDEGKRQIVFLKDLKGEMFFKILDFLLRKVNEVMAEFISKDVEDIERSCKHSLVLVWGLWLGTAQDLSMIPLDWYLKYRKLLDDMFGKDSLKKGTS